VELHIVEARPSLGDFDLFCQGVVKTKCQISLQPNLDSIMIISHCLYWLILLDSFEASNGSQTMLSGLFTPPRASYNEVKSYNVGIMGYFIRHKEDLRMNGYHDQSMGMYVAV